MTARSIPLLLVCLAWISGCATSPRDRMQVAPETREHSALQIDEALIDQKIDFLEGVLKREALSKEDRETATVLLSAYKQLKASASSRLGEKGYQRLILSLLNAVGRIDEAYYGEKEIGQRDKDSLARFAGKRQAIIDLYLKGDYKGVIQGASELKSHFGADAITPEMGLLLALSLAREGDLKQAIQIGEGISDELNRLPDGVELRTRTAEWQLALGSREKALQVYEGLTEKEGQRADRLQELGQQVRAVERKGETGESAAAEPEAGPVPDDLSQEGEYTMDQILQKVHSLVQEHAYSKARILILRERLRIGEGPEAELLDKELEQIDQHEAGLNAQKEMRDDSLKETQEAARQMIEKEDYEAAIDSFSKVGGSKELDAESRELKEKAVEGLINKERNRAAELFLAARKTSNPSKKKELLESAYNMLNGLIKKYPSSPLNQKLKSNIAVVQKELDKLR
ncbi:MAG: hypothetical protein QG552_245 [Thermodesulfobacteriota bacterium]|nr:hypothetical protein [Thermodesulfobacteriota bacterium]